MADKSPALVGVTVTTVGAGDYSCGPALAPLDVSVTFRALNSGVFADGDTFPYECRQGSVFERGRGTWHSSGNTITRTLITSNSNNNTAPITWGGGTKILFVDSGEGLTARSALGLGTAAVLDVGTTANKVVQLDGTGKLPSGTDVSQCTGFPAAVAPSVPSGSITVWYQSAAPSGWTRLTALDDCVISITNSIGFGGGGPHAAGTFVAGGWDQSTGLSVGGHSITVAEMAAHSHGPTAGFFVESTGSGGTLGAPGGTNLTTALGTDISGAGTAHTHPVSSASTWRPPSAKMLMASKN